MTEEKDFWINKDEVGALSNSEGTVYKVTQETMNREGWYKLADDEQVVKKAELTKEEAEFVEKNNALELMTIEELKKKIEAIDVPEEAKLTIHVNTEDDIQVKNTEDQIVLFQKNKGDIDVVVCIDNEEQKMLTISSTEDGVLFLDIGDFLYATDVVGVFINVLRVCHEYMKSSV